MGKIMEINERFKSGEWTRRIDVSDFVSRNLTPYTRDPSYLKRPSQRTKKL